MNREERIQEQIADMKRGLDSITIDAFRMTKEYVGEKYHHLSPTFRGHYRYWLQHCRKYFMKDKNGARYRICSFDEMVSYYTKRKGL